MSTEILNFVKQYSVYSGCIIFTFGVIGNALNILVFTQLKQFHNNRCAFYLTIESISNFIYQFMSISLTILTSIYGDDATERSIIWCRFRYILAQTLILITFYMICLASIDEFFSSNYRFNLRQMCTMKIARYISFTLILISIIHSLIFSFFFDIQLSVGCVISNYLWIKYATFVFYPILTGFLPIVTASLFSILAFRNVRRIVRLNLSISRRQLDRQMTALVLIRVIFFVILVFPYGIYRIYIINYPFSKTKPMEYAIGRLIQTIFLSFVTLNYTVSFYIFMISSLPFRRQVKFVLINKFQCFIKHNQIHPNMSSAAIY